MVDSLIETVRGMRGQLIALRRSANAYDADLRNVLNRALDDLTVVATELEEHAVRVGVLARELGQARDEAAEVESVYRELFDAVADGLIVTNRHGAVVDVNLAARSLLGAELRELRRAPLPQFVDGPDQHAVIRLAHQAHYAGARGSAEVRVTPSRGEAFPAAISVAPGQGGEKLYWTIRDITDEKRRASDLTAALDERVEADRARSAFLLAMAHDLRSPVNGILASADALEAGDDALPTPVLRALTSIKANASSLRRLQVQFLDLERLGRRVVVARPRPVNVTEVVEQVAKEVDLGDRLVEFDLPAVEAEVDPGLLESIVRNLLENAARHTPSLTRVSVRLRAEGEGVLLLTVEDDGPGVPADRRDAVFDMFGHVDPDDRSGGMGAGLYLVRRFAELHGGRAWVEEREGGGASFRIALPLQ